MNLTAIAIGGAFGAVGRYGLSRLMIKLLPGAFPWGTFVVNLLGCLVMGAIMAHVSKIALYPVLQAGVVTGVLGALTTFSTFSLEVVILVERREFLIAGLYLVGSVLAGVLGIVAGGGAARLLSGR